MSRRFPLATVLRVRRIQEDLAGAAAIRARLAVTAAEGDLCQRDARVEEAVARVVPQHAAALTGLMASRLSLAGEAAAARRRVTDAEGVAGHRLGDWAQARAARRGVERLAERHHTRERAQAEREAQRALDERTGAGRHRGAPS